MSKLILGLNCDKVEVWQWMTMYYLPLWLIYIYILLLSFFFILNRMEFWNLLLITKKILIEFHTFFLFFWCCKELNRCINTIKWSCLKKISMAGCLQVLILTFVVYLRSRGNNFTLIFELITIQTCQTLYKHCICYYQDFDVLRQVNKGDQL